MADPPGNGTPTQVLDAEQICRYENDGYLYLEDALTDRQLTDLRAVFDGWVEESRAHDGAYGETFDGRPRFDVDPGLHCLRLGSHHHPGPESAHGDVSRSSTLVAAGS